MKLAFAGKGGAGKTSLTSWMGDYLARTGRDVWMLDADTALSLGQASGLAPDELPEPLILREDLVRERIGSGYLNLNPEVGDLPESLAVDLPLVGDFRPVLCPGRKRLLVMGTVTGAGGGCACAANALLKAVLAHIILDRDAWVLVDLEAGVEHLGRGVVSGVDGLVVVSEPSMRSLETAARIGVLAGELGLDRQMLVMNRYSGNGSLPKMEGLPEKHLSIPMLDSLLEQQMRTASVLGLSQSDLLDQIAGRLVDYFESRT